MTALNKYIIAFTTLAIVLSGCQPSKKTHLARLYLQGIDSANISAINNTPEQIIQKGEKLAITVYSDNPAATAIFNQLQNGGGSFTGSANAASGAGGGTGSGGGGYLVDERGNILFHSLGVLHVDGLTKLQLIKLLEEKLDTVLNHPYVDIKFLNKRVTILGEVTKPGTINMPEEKISILDAIALSGEITNFGRKDNILVVREENGKRTTGRLNIKDPAVYKSDFFYLHKDDMVYIEPDRKKPAGTDQTTIRNITLLATLISTVALVYSIFRN